MAKRRFLLKVGTHGEVGRSYQQGEIVESNDNLAFQFPNKFEEIGIVKTMATVNSTIRGGGLVAFKRKDGKYDVVNLTAGKKLNVVPLEKTEALEMTKGKVSHSKVAAELSETTGK